MQTMKVPMSWISRQLHFYSAFASAKPCDLGQSPSPLLVTAFSKKLKKQKCLAHSKLARLIVLMGKTRAFAVKFLYILFQNIHRINNSSFEIVMSSSEGYFKLSPEMSIMPVSSHQFQLIQVYVF